MCALLVAMLGWHGCVGQEPLGLISGQVTLDGQPVEEGLVIFSNHSKGVHMTAQIEDGRYEFQTAKGFGLPLGEYQVAVNPPVVAPPMPGAPTTSHARMPVTIPQPYLKPTESGLRTDVVAGRNEFNIEMHSE